MGFAPVRQEIGIASYLLFAYWSPTPIGMRCTATVAFHRCSDTTSLSCGQMPAQALFAVYHHAFPPCSPLSGLGAVVVRHGVTVMGSQGFGRGCMRHPQSSRLHATVSLLSQVTDLPRDLPPRCLARLPVYLDQLALSVHSGIACLVTKQGLGFTRGPAPSVPGATSRLAGRAGTCGNPGAPTRDRCHFGLGDGAQIYIMMTCEYSELG